MGVNEMDYGVIGQRIRETRLKLGWQQAELADCDSAELQAFLEIIQAAKKVIRKNRKIITTA